jgi:hypothetical protein
MISAASLNEPSAGWSEDELRAFAAYRKACQPASNGEMNAFCPAPDGVLRASIGEMAASSMADRRGQAAESAVAVAPALRQSAA